MTKFIDRTEKTEENPQRKTTFISFVNKDASADNTVKPIFIPCDFDSVELIGTGTNGISAFMAKSADGGNIIYLGLKGDEFNQ